MSHEELIATIRDWDAAMVANDPVAIGRHMADDWRIIGADGRVSDKTGFLSLIESGALSHDEMTSDDLEIRTYGDVAVVLARGVSGGLYRGRAFREVERGSNVFVRSDGRWRCVLTHLSRLEE